NVVAIILLYSPLLIFYKQI
ncbi:hypothetical protein, partial [Plasmodium yoelii yoelii]